jgi:hypothetical protein
MKIRRATAQSKKWQHGVKMAENAGFCLVG